MICFDFLVFQVNLTVEMAASEGWSTEVPVIAKSQAWSVNLDGALDSTGVVFNESWLILCPPGIEFSEDILDLHINTFQVVSSDSTDVTTEKFDVTESTFVELLELSLVKGCAFFQSSLKCGTLSDNSGIKIGNVTTNSGVLLSDTGIELSLDLLDECMRASFPGLDLSNNSLFEGIDLGEEHGLLGGNPVDSLGPASSSESLWHHTFNFSAKIAGSGFRPFFNLSFPCSNLDGKFINVLDSLCGDSLKV